MPQRLWGRRRVLSWALAALAGVWGPALPAQVQRAADAGLLISVTADRVIRLVPSLILTRAEADEIVALLAPLVREFLTEQESAAA